MEPVKQKCPHCGKYYDLGINGTVNGCDQCEGVVRNVLDGTIITDINKPCAFPEWMFREDS